MTQEMERLREEVHRRNAALAAASHELRAPVDVMVGFARTLLQPDMGTNAELREELLDRIVAQGDRLLREIDSALRDAQLELEPGEPS